MPHTRSPSRLTAGVDEGVADLVTALNTVPGVMTPGSCQPGPDRARVTSCTHDRARTRYQYGGGGNNALPLADVTCLPSQARAVANAVRSGAAHISAGDR